ncbi:MAG: hypothetical protein ACFB12_24980 [Leptolyngbyaceae cyanobacterium]
MAATESPPSKEESSQFLAKLSGGIFPKSFAKTSNIDSAGFSASLSKSVLYIQVSFDILEQALPKCGLKLKLRLGLS